MGTLFLPAGSTILVLPAIARQVSWLTAASHPPLTLSAGPVWDALYTLSSLPNVAFAATDQGREKSRGTVHRAPKGQRTPVAPRSSYYGQ